MSALVPHRQFDPDCPEQLDRPGMDRAVLREELTTLERFNRCLGGHWLVLHYVKRFVEAAKPASLSLLDLATGSADIPRAIAAWARKRGLPVDITAVDRNADVLHMARESCRNWPEIRFEQHDLRDLPHPAGRFDLVLCSLALHHFTATDAIAILRRIRELARCGYIVNDLCRNWPAILTVTLVTRFLARSPVFRQDAVMSCRAAFTLEELHGLAGQAGLEGFQIRRHHGFFRIVLEGRK
jgi:2-polyprenyl-3-methyl-5-hydroxy-6-metoxy-1,4-benzoquinol methylase